MAYGFYDETMERLRRIHPDKCITDKDAVILLSQEIEQYREKIQRLQRESDGMLSEYERNNLLKNCQMLDKELHVCKSDNQMLKDVIVRLSMRITGVLE